MRTYKRAVVALNTFCFVPTRHHNGHATLFVRSCAKLILTVGMILKGRHRQPVAFHHIDGFEQLTHLFYNLLAAFNRNMLNFVGCIFPIFRNLNFGKRRSTSINSFVVCIYNCLSFFGIRLCSSIFHIAYCIFLRQNTRQRKERRLQHRVCALAHAYLFCQVDGVNEIHVNLVFVNVALSLSI